MKYTWYKPHVCTGCRHFTLSLRWCELLNEQIDNIKLCEGDT